MAMVFLLGQVTQFGIYLFSVCLHNIVTGLPINDIIQHYEPLNLDSDSIWEEHHREKRGTGSGLKLQFRAFDRDFNLLLKRDNHVFADDVVFETSNSEISHDTSRTYYGEDEGEDSGKNMVHGMVTSAGCFSGQIIHPTDTYIIECATRYFSSPAHFNTIIYRLSDVNFDFNKTRCESDALHLKFREIHPREKENIENESGKEKYLRRSKRAVDPSKTVCELYLQADHLYYQKFQSNVDTVIEQLTSHVTSVNNIFRAIDFDGNGSPDNIGFIIKRVKIHTDPTVAGYRFSGSYSVEKFLDLHSQDNYDAFCLSIIFTNRDFNNGVLGLAWTAAPGYAGGVCEKHGVFSGESKSLNTAIVTILNYGVDVSTAVTHTTLAHEIGHNFGAEHDDSNNQECTPGGEDGNYIMYSHATSGYQKNNVLFSNCSIQYMNPILNDKARDSKPEACFKAFSAAICGNKVVETGELCDCGWEEDCTESCCVPQSSTPGSSTPCTRKPGTTCSPSEGPCCKSTCTLYSAGENFVCRANTSCTSEAKCDGSSEACPSSQPKANGTLCGEEQVCFLGECTGSLCLASGLLPCQCIPTNANDWKDENLCKVCCIHNGTCRLSDDIPGVPTAKAQPGSPCNSYKGYCDVFQVCREVDPSGPLNVLKNLLLDGQLFDTLKTFLTKHWYVGIAAGMALFIVLGLMVKFCSKSHGPPKQKKNNQVEPSRHSQEMAMQHGRHGQRY